MRPTLVCGLALALPMSGCYVIPIDHQGRISGGHAYAPAPTTLPAAPPVPVNLIAKLYPVNDAAAATGTIFGAVTNHLNGRGTFTLTAHGESFTGEATRDGTEGHRGVANATGARGNFVRCTYTMNHSTQGSGECTFSNGARYTFHLSG